MKAAPTPATSLVKQIDIPQGPARRLKVSVAWTDNNYQAEALQCPMALSVARTTAPAELRVGNRAAGTPLTQGDQLNNVQQVTWPNAAPGSYEIRLDWFNINPDPQLPPIPVSVAWSVV